jgi:hypothetical protein
VVILGILLIVKLCALLVIVRKQQRISRKGENQIDNKPAGVITMIERCENYHSDKKGRGWVRK